ncbi:MAG: GNAT family N-acetyltransferase [Bacteroidetes bacterium RIFOXYA12_FULL_35_11]|nr:MAG: GNAT family N-acetyltransferase [Bacteroidetes bacterium GWF2_35_48]OFY82552.1 MAG: GNAT family N-acetyltransferase [Bacteroidetes bacterium RIFOXYA12_FULL_35_11]OFY93180.1 MAG: GNAT family N-acetyltransferase [Bacteroidetes bacterium RIFOXYB2_FULL_35_7]HBX52831.1 GNAT family N-acetyltransferase [Bacteroidales bacterium]
MKHLTKISGFIIQEAKEKDIDLILQFIKELALYEKLFDKVTANIETLRQSLFSESKIAEAVIGYYNDSPVAFAIYFHNFSTFVGKKGLYLEDLYVKPEMRGKGLGKEMLLYLVRLAKERDCGRLEWAVLDWNTSAINFYKSLGAQPMDDWTIFRLDADAIKKISE